MVRIWAQLGYYYKLMDNTRSTLDSATSARCRKANRNPRSKYKSHSRAFKDTVNAYASSSSAHGVAYIFELDRLPIERLFWVFCLGFALVFRYPEMLHLYIIDVSI